LLLRIWGLFNKIHLSSFFSAFAAPAGQAGVVISGSDIESEWIAAQRGIAASARVHVEH
jgi:hypothetical protein